MPNTNAFEQVVHEKKMFKDLSHFPPVWTLILTNLNPHFLEMLPTKFG